MGTTGPGSAEKSRRAGRLSPVAVPVWFVHLGPAPVPKLRNFTPYANFRFYSLDTSRTVADGANGFRLLVESSNYGFQPVYDPAGLTVTLSVDDPTLAEVGFNGTTGQTVSFTIPQGQYENYVANPQWIPLAPGTPTLTISAPGVQTFSTQLTIDP